MSSRRNFLAKNALATFAFIMPKPNSFISKILTTPNSTKKNNQLIILHGNDVGKKYLILKNTDYHVLNLNTVNNDISGSFSNYNKPAIDNLLPYEITNKGYIDIGIIYFNEENQFDNLNNTAWFLKKEKRCHLIVCVYQHNLNRHTNNFLKEIELAKSSSNIDLIICHKQNALRYNTFIAHNKNKHEVIINATFGNVDTSLGKIKIYFNDALQKINIAC